MIEKSKKTSAVLDKVEKGIIGLLFISILAYYFITGYDDIKSSEFYPIVLLLQVILLGLYIYLTQDKYSAFLIGLAFLPIGAYLRKENPALGDQLMLLGELAQLALGIYFIYKTIIESKKNKDWEMFGTLVAIGFLFPIVYHFFLAGKELLMIYSFAYAFILGTVMYNENLWDKYNKAEKIILTYVLVAALVEVVLISIRLL